MSKINFPKKQEQRLIPKYLLEYSEELVKNHPDPSESWGGSGSTYTAGEGIVIENNEISVDAEDVALVKNLATVAFSGSYSDLSNKPDLSVYELKEDAFSGDYNDLTNKPTLFSGNYNDLTNKPDLSVYELKSEAFSGDYDDLTDKPDLSVYELKSEAFSGNYNDLTNKPDLSVYELKSEAFSGDYNDLTNKPTIPDAVSGTNDGTNWTTITIGNTTKAIPAGGGTTYTAGTWIGITNDIINVSNPYISLIDSNNLPRVMISDHTNGTTPSFGNAKYCNISPLGFGINDRTKSQPTGGPSSNAYTYYNWDKITFDGTWDLALPTKSGTIALTSDIPTVPTNISAFTNDSGYITGITSSMVTTALGYTPGTSNFSGSYNDLTNKPNLSIYAQTANLGTAAFIDEDSLSIDYSQLTNTPTIPVVPTNVSAFTNDAGYITGITSSDVTTALGYTPGTSNFSGDYDDLTDKPTIPTVNNNTITITQDGVTKGSFTLNQNTNQTINVDGTPNMIGEVIFSTTPTTGVTTYPINLTKDITQYDYIEIYYNVNDNTIQKWCQTFPNPAVNDRINLTCFGNGTIRVYTKNTIFNIATATSLVLVNSAQQRVGNNEATTVGISTTEFHCRPYKIIGYKQNSAPIVTYDNLYRNNDSFAFSSIANLQGYLTSAGKTIQFTVTTPKLLTNVTSITVDNLYTVIRGVGGYINGSSYIDYANTTGYIVTAYKATDNMITITIDATNAYSSGTNNTPVALAFNPNNNNGIKLTFTV